MIRIFVGYDPKESAAFHVLCHSIHRLSSEPVSITPLRLSQLYTVFRRERDPKQSTDFSFTRFLVPLLCDYTGWALYMDCDMMLRGDIAELWAQRDPRVDVHVVQHDYLPATERKMDDQAQTTYARKNWSSLMLMNCTRCRTLTNDVVHEASGLSLHQFEWADFVAHLYSEWNHLVGEYTYRPDAKLVHWTLGGPWLAEYSGADYATEWYEMLMSLMNEEGPPDATSRLLQLSG